MKKRILSVVVSLIMSAKLFAALPVWAADSETARIQQEIKEDAEIKGLLDQYFLYRESQFTTKHYKGTQEVSVSGLTNRISSQVESEAGMRITSLQDMAARMEVSFQHVTTEYAVSSISTEEDGIVVNVYEWNMIEYQCDGLDSVDIMGFGTDHTLYLKKDADGAYHVIRDSFDERDMTGACSSDVAANAVNETDMDDFISERLGAESVAAPKGISSYNASAAIAYANKWCGVSTINTVVEGMNHEKYNPAYYYADADCANFVSQCLYTGGIACIDGDYGTGWYYKVPPATSIPISGGINTGSAPWIRVSAFDTFWRNRGIDRYTANGSLANENTIIPGNPVYYLTGSGGASGHLMICTGYNSAGIPVINAHNNDAYKVPITNYSGNTLYTLQFKTCAHSYTYRDYAPAIHIGTCSLCQHQKRESHTWADQGTSYRCSKCGRVFTNS